MDVRSKLSIITEEIKGLNQCLKSIRNVTIDIEDRLVEHSKYLKKLDKLLHGSNEEDEL